MNWTALKTDKLLTNGEICVPVTYTSDSGETSYESYRTRVMSPDWPDSLIRARLIELNAIDLSLVQLGSVKPPPIIPSPTQDELDLTDISRPTAFAFQFIYHLLGRLRNQGSACRYK